ncbi:MAG: hypothetical protein ACLPV2_16230 [Steroidobacteraceae bacterium]
MAVHRGHPSGQCKVCNHAERARIELLIAGGGASHRAVGRKYQLSHWAIGRHWANHVTNERKAALIVGPVEREALASRVAEESSSLLDHFKAVRSALYDLLVKAHAAGDGQTGAMLSGRLHENLNSIARLTGELASSPLVSITNNQQNVSVMMESPEFAQFQARLVAALRDFPEARSAVLAEFERLEVASGDGTLPSAVPRLIQQGCAA